jgi:hypothetical protein
VKAVSFDNLFQISNVHKAFRILKKNRNIEESIRLTELIGKITEISQNQELDEEEKWMDSAPDDFL